jgi:hypothetical protein
MKQNILLIATCLCGLATSSQAALIAWYQFNEGAGASTALNAVVGSTTGAIQAGVTTGVAGISGNAYSFNDSTVNGFVDMGNANFFSSITSSGQLSYSVWINTTLTTGNRNVVVFAGLDTSSQSYTDLGYSGAEAGHQGQAYDRNRPNLLNGPQTTGIFSDGIVVNDGNWHHLALTVNLSTSQLQLYVDGALANSQTMTTSAFPAFNNFEIGRLGRSVPADAYGGLVDEVQVYDKALTGSEVQFLFNNPGLSIASIPEPSTVAMAVPGVGLLLLAYRRRARKSFGSESPTV